MNYVFLMNNLYCKVNFTNTWRGFLFYIFFQSTLVENFVWNYVVIYVFRLLSVKVYLNIKAINLQSVRHNELPDCYDFRTMVGHVFITALAFLPF